jgi:acyl carrier protein
MNIYQWILDTIINQLEHDETIELDPKKAFNELGIDSIGIMTLFVNVEEKFNITIDEDTLIDSSVNTIEDLCNYIENRLESNQSSPITNF